MIDINVRSIIVKKDKATPNGWYYLDKNNNQAQRREEVYFLFCQNS